MIFLIEKFFKIFQNVRFLNIYTFRKVKDTPLYLEFFVESF